MLFWLISSPEVATPPALDAFPGEKKHASVLEHLDPAQRCRHVRPFRDAEAAVLHQFLRVVLIQLILRRARKGDIARDAPGPLPGVERDLEPVGVILDPVSCAGTHFEHIVDLLAADPILVMDESIGSRKGHDFPPSCDTFSAAPQATFPNPERATVLPAIDCPLDLSISSAK